MRERIASLPKPRLESTFSVEEALLERRSVREYTASPISLADVSQLLWAAAGMTQGGRRRTIPSAGALYPLELYLAAGRVDGLDDGLYHFRLERHELVEVAAADVRPQLAEAALQQTWMVDAAAIIVIIGVVERTAAKYGQRAIRYVHMEVGAATQNIYLQAAALGLGTVVVGAFSDGRVKQILGLSAEEQPFCILPVGKP